MTAPVPDTRVEAGQHAEAPLVSIAVVTHGRPAFLARCLESCARQAYPQRELVVVLNPDDPASADVAERHGAKIVRTHRNLGAFAGINLAIANSAGALVMALDDDAWFESDDGLARLVDVLSHHPDAAAVTCNIRGPCEGEPYDAIRPIFLFKLGFTLFRRELLQHGTGYFPDRLFRAGAETFFANRVYEEGRQILVVHDVWIYHAYTATGRSSYAANFHAVRSHALVVVLQEPLPLVLPRLAVKVVRSFVRIAMQRRAFPAWLYGWMSFVGNLGWALKHRRPVSMRTFLLSRKLTADAGDAARVVVRESAEQV